MHLIIFTNTIVSKGGNVTKANKDKMPSRVIKITLRSWQHPLIPPAAVRSGDVHKLVPHARQNIRPQIGWIVILRYRCPGIPEDQVGRRRRDVPNTLIDLARERPWHPRSVTLDEEHLRGAEVVPPDLLDELTRPANEYAGANLLRSHDLPESMQGGELILHHRSSVGHRSLAESHLQREVDVGLSIAGYFDKISGEWSAVH
jgi:hypothetical protein